MKNKLQDKLYNHATSVDTDEIWNGIQKKKKRRVFLFFFLGMIAFALAIYFMTSNSVENTDVVLTNSIGNETIVKSQTKLNETPILDEHNNQHASQVFNELDSKPISQIESKPNLAVLEAEKKNKTTYQKPTSFQNAITKNKIIATNITTTKKFEQNTVNRSNKIIANTIVTEIDRKPNTVDIKTEAFKEEQEREVNDIKKIKTTAISPLNNNRELDNKLNWISPIKRNSQRSITINIGTIFTQNELVNSTKSLPGINASLLFSKYLNTKLKAGMGLNFVQHREHTKAVYKYAIPKEVETIVTEIYHQDGTVETINSLVTVIDNYERSISNVNTKSRIDICLRPSYHLLSIGRLSTSVLGQVNYTLASWNKGLELREDYEGFYDIHTDEMHIINKSNMLSYRFGLEAAFLISDHLSVGITAQRYNSLTSFYTDQNFTYKGYIGGISIEYLW